jgi:tripartite-type tricarboxylate transporter receptor subunit TctC
VQLTYTGYGLAAPHLQSGKLKPLAITGTERLAALPNVLPLSKFDSDPQFASGFAVYGPAKMPGAIQERLSSEFRKALSSPQSAKMMEGSMEPVGSTPAEFAASIKSDRTNAARVFKVLGVKATEAPQ